MSSNRIDGKQLGIDWVISICKVISDKLFRYDLLRADFESL